tara:strand:+ start:3015 stop:4631 length:1617 start_codon:yes stop_codon:yes gene_type:complete
MKYLIISGSSDLGKSYINLLKKSNVEIVSTYFKSKIKNKRIKQIYLDLGNKLSVKEFLSNKNIRNWNYLIFLTGNLGPIGTFNKVKINEWIKSYKLNFLSQIYLLQKLLNYKNKNLSKVIFTSGGATNSDNENLSSYNLAKIGLIKLCELFNKEIKDTSFTCIGPGFIDTKIHNIVKKNSKKFKVKYEEYKEKRLTNKFKPKDFSKKLNLIIKSNNNFFNGRNLSLQNDNIDKDFIEILKFDKNIYKLRRDFNNIIHSDIRFDIDEFIKFIFNQTSFQFPGGATHEFFGRLVKLYFAKKIIKNEKINFFDFDLKFPLINFGNRNSIDLFGLDEIIIFCFYNNMRNYYKKVCDIGGNIGLHSLILAKMGFDVTMYEPDNFHFKIAKQIFKKNKVNTIKANKMAVSNKNTIVKFTKILGNTTGSYIKNKKKGYGKKKIYKVNAIDAKSLNEKFDLIKIDAEGSEIDIIKKFNKKTFKKTDIIMEISTHLNKKLMWEMKKKLNLKIYSQKKGWKKVTKLQDLPNTHREGSIFISSKNKFLR